MPPPATGKLRTSYLFFAVLAVWLLAQILFLFHDLGANPQTDTQIIAYSFQFLDAIRSGHIGDYLLEVRKYPLFLSLLFSPIFLLTLGSLLLVGTIPSIAEIPGYLFQAPVALHFVARFTVLAFAIATVVIVYQTVKRLEDKKSAAAASALLASSFLFFTFSTAIRPHILVTFWTVASFAFSLQLAKHPSRKNMLGAFGCAVVAFGSLQNGIFTFIFPIWGYCSAHRISLRTLFQCIGILVLCGCISILIGYPFIFQSIAGNSPGIGLDLGHNISLESPWTGGGFAAVLMTLLGSETFLFLFLLWSTWQRITAKRWEEWVTPVALFLLPYFLLFGVYADTQPRYFVITLPFLAFLGARTMATSHRIIQGIFALMLIVAFFKLGWLAALPNTYQLAGAEALRRNVPVASDIPYYYLGLIPTKESIGEPAMARERYYLSRETDMPGALPIVSRDALDAEVIIQSDHDQKTAPPAPWQLCEHFIASPLGEGIFLWTETRMVWQEIATGQRLGPNISVFCKNP